jgi:release factor glutamine methyltransferase
MITVEAPVFAATLSRQAAQRRLAQTFAAGGVETAELDARVLLCAALGIDHASLVRDPDLCIGAAAGAAIEAFCAQRLAREPVSRILGRREFWDLEFAIGPAVLDPRPDTETLIEAAQDLMQHRRNEALRVLDLGTGSGAILVALLSIFPNATGFGVDISTAAAATAAANVARLGFGERGFVLCGDWTSALRGPFDLVVANPPYIARAAIAELAPEVRLHDPSLALDGGEDGLAAYRILAPAAAALLAPGGLLAFECGFGQAGDVAALIRAAGLGGRLAIRRDLAGVARVVITQRSGGAH